MSAIGQYILTVVSATILVSIVTTLVGNKSSTAPYIRLVGSLFIAVTVFSPLLGIRADGIVGYFSSVDASADRIIVESQATVHNQKVSIIKEKTEAYILEKAESLSLNISVEIDFDDANSVAPTTVRIYGSVSPYAKDQLSKAISSDLGIPEEQQKWY